MALLDDVKKTLIAELQAKGYNPNESDVHVAAVKAIELVQKANPAPAPAKPAAPAPVV